MIDPWILLGWLFVGLIVITILTTIGFWYRMWRSP